MNQFFGVIFFFTPECYSDGNGQAHSAFSSVLMYSVYPQDQTEEQWSRNNLPTHKIWMGVK